jgi:hypothetical protein
MPDAHGIDKARNSSLSSTTTRFDESVEAAGA